MATVLMQIKVKPKARASSLMQAPDGTWLAKVKSPPVDGKANEELVALVAEHFRCRKAAVSIKSGASGRIKLVKVQASSVRAIVVVVALPLGTLFLHRRIDRHIQSLKGL